MDGPVLDPHDIIESMHLFLIWCRRPNGYQRCEDVPLGGVKIDLGAVAKTNTIVSVSVCLIRS